MSTGKISSGNFHLRSATVCSIVGTALLYLQTEAHFIKYSENLKKCPRGLTETFITQSLRFQKNFQYCAVPKSKF